MINLDQVHVKEIMTSRIVTVEMDDTLDVVKNIFDHVSFHHLLVIDNGVLVGVLSDRDFFKAVSPNLDSAAETLRDTQTLTKRVHQIMSREVKTVNDSAMLSEVVKLFHAYTISSVPVIDQNSKPVGIVSWRDIMRILIDSHY